MLSLHRTLSLRYFWRRRSRSALVVLSIALGVATLVGTRALSQNMSQSAHATANPLGGLSDLQISNGEAGVPAAVVGELKETPLPGVQEVRPLVVGWVNLPEHDSRAVRLFGVDLDTSAAPGQEAKLEKWGLELQSADPPLTLEDRRDLLFGTAYPSFVGRLLDTECLAGGWRLKLRVGAKTSTVLRFGTVDAHAEAAVLGGSVLFMRLGDAARVLDRPGLVTRLDVTLAPGADREQVRRLLQEKLGSRAQVLTPQETADRVNDLLVGIELGFTLGGLCALVVGLFLVYNTLSVSVAERRHDIGILRSVGATRAQVAGLFTGEAFVLGLVGSALGVPLGWALAYVAIGPFQRTLTEIAGTPIELSRLPPLGRETLVLALVAGTVVALLAALVPALSAAGEEPAEAVRRAATGPRAAYRLLHAALCLFLILSGLALVSLRSQLPPRVGGFGALVLLLVGLLAATPLLTAGVARLLQPIFRHLFGVTERLAADNLARSPARTGLVVGALAAGVALVVHTAGVTASSEDAALTWVDRTLAADLFVTAYNPEAPGGNQTMDERIGRLLHTVPEVERVVPVRFARVSFGNVVVWVTALDPVAFYSERLQQPLPGLKAFPGLTERGTVIVSENFAAQHHVRVGDCIALQGSHGPVELSVIGTILDYNWARGSVFLDRDQYKEQFHDDLVDVYELYLRPESLSSAGLPSADGRPDVEAVAETLRRRWGAEESLFVVSRSTVRDAIRQMIRRMSIFSYGQEIVVVIVAALGVLTALLISVLQRQRELGLLRAVGASRSQVLRSVLAEAMLMGIVGALLGTLFGIPLEWYALHVILLDETGFTFPTEVPWPQVAVVIGLGLGIATLAGLLPALRAVRLRIADAIAYE
jgi:putative ABC transport system permease protein